MKRMIRNVQAASDFRSFDGYDVDELADLFPDIYDAYFANIAEDVDTVYIPRSVAKYPYIGLLDKNGEYYMWDGRGKEGPGWYEVSFAELADFLY